MNTATVLPHQVACNTVGSGHYSCLDDTSIKLGVFFNPIRQGRVLVEKHDGVKFEERSSWPTKMLLTSGIVPTKRRRQSGATAIIFFKNVRFALDKKGRILCEQYKTRDPRTKKEAMACWYSPAEFKQFRLECKQEAMNQQKTSFRENFSAVYAACTKGSFKGVTRERAYISAASCRGLEVVVFPTLHSDRKNAIATVLKTQATLPDGMGVVAREEAIASASRFLSKQARQLARVLGSGDAAVVVANNRIAALQNEKGVVPHCFINC